MKPLLLLAASSLALYVAMPAAGTRGAVAAHLVLVVLMLLAWKAVRAGGDPAWRLALAAAVLFRVALVPASPIFSDDVYRYVWDGRVQVAGHHPYKFAPDHPMRAMLRDEVIYPRINHPDIPTIYPPLSELIFAALAYAKLSVTGIKAAMALFDVGVIAALTALLRALGLPRDRAILYAWNPLAVAETAWSGHVEPAGILLLLLALGWITRGLGARAAAALAGAVQTKLLPLLLVPGFVRRLKARDLLVGVAVAAVIGAPYALRGPAYGAGVLAYAHRWEHGSVAFPLVLRAYEALDPAPALKSAIAWAQGRWGTADTRLWDLLYRSIWPQELARLTVAAMALGWAVGQSFRPRLDASHEARLALGGALLLAPTLHPWYVLWVLPLAAAHLAGGWILLAGLIPLQYLSGAGEVSWGWRLVIVLPPVAWMARDSWRDWRMRRRAPDAI